MKTKSLARAVLPVVYLFGVTVFMGADNGPVEVKISNVHLCCKGCTSAVDKAAAKIQGVTCTPNQDEGSVTLQASSNETLQHALNEIAAAGFYGTLSNQSVKYKPIEFSQEKVSKLEISHVHNCCPGCTKVLISAIEGVPGVTSHTVKNKATSFVVEGDFSPAEVVKSLQSVGFYPTVK